MKRELDESQDLLARGEKSRKRSTGYSFAGLALEISGGVGIVGDLASISSIPAPTLRENVIRGVIALGGVLLMVTGYGVYRRSLREQTSAYSFYSQAQDHDQALDILRRRKQ